MEERKETFHVRASVNNIRWGVIEWLQKRNYKRRDNKETFDNQSEGVIDLIFRTVFAPKIPFLSVYSEQDIPVRGRTGRSRGLEGKAGIKGTGGGRIVSTTVDRDRNEEIVTFSRFPAR